jgi:hypothetical protein
MEGKDGVVAAELQRRCKDTLFFAFGEKKV